MILLVAKSIAFIVIYLFIGLIFAAWYKSRNRCNPKKETLKIMCLAIVAWPSLLVFIPIMWVSDFLKWLSNVVWEITEQKD